ncbi:Subunit of heteropentameric Replication factor C (RF-C) [Entomophthora muscae]|uniref:Subunit of heteropentameric Replication factor C (RF-C) n=2 Tax=Entomophthora muscae TaxID=34485 RepID=A0ACC2TIX1_9FUNG|nr:Subunit of heteropentameric Replication factor C (RF-C) [Entomophthora muscae]
MSLWVDDYRPDSIKTLSYHNDITEQIKRLGNSGDLPHILFYGPSGAGKKTRINALLKEIFGPGIEKVHIDMRQFTTPSNKRLEIAVLSSNFHMELNPSDAGIHDRLVIQTLIKEIAQTQQIDANSARKFKVIVISEADCLSKAAQQALRRTMEKYMGNLRLILCANTTSNILSPIRSRCLLLRVPAPSCDQIASILLDIGNKVEIDLPMQLATNIAQSSGRNLRKAILMLEAAHLQNQILSPSTAVPIPEWEIYIKETARFIVRNPSPQSLLEVRTRLYELLAKCIPPPTLIRMLALEISKSVNDRIKPEIIHQAAIYEHRMKGGQKFIVHLEAFVAKAMSIHKREMLNLY